MIDYTKILENYNKEHSHKQQEANSSNLAEDNRSTANSDELGTTNIKKDNAEEEVYIIPRFTIEEAEEISKIFVEQNVDYESTTGNYNYYYFLIKKTNLKNAVKIIKEYLEERQHTDAKFTGECPGCQTQIKDVITCPECGLTLAFDNNEILKDHPFLKLLKENNLL